MVMIAGDMRMTAMLSTTGPTGISLARCWVNDSLGGDFSSQQQLRCRWQCRLHPLWQVVWQPQVTSVPHPQPGEPA